MCKIREMNLEIAKYYGYEAQSNQLVEECAELIQAVNKYRRVETGLGQPVAEDKKAIARDNLVEEIADVELMLEQVKYLLQIPEDEILAVKTFKVTAIDLDKYHKSDRAEFNKAYRKGKLSHYQYMSIAYVLVLGYTQDELAFVMGVDQSVISKNINSGIKRIQRELRAYLEED